MTGGTITTGLELLRARHSDAQGLPTTWADLTDSVNLMAGNLTGFAPLTTGYFLHAR